jgi:hypothetical protein
MRIAKGAERIRLLRQQQAAEAGRKKRLEAIMPSIKIDTRRITLVKLRFMGEQPDERYADFR